jgi:hypothetical protein
MALIEANFEQVPDQILPIDNGTYEASIISATIEHVQGDDTKKKLVVEHEIVGPTGSPMIGRKTTNHISLKMLTTIKRLALSAGVVVGPQGLDTDELVGKICSITVQRENYKDKNGEMKEAARIKDYNIPAA